MTMLHKICNVLIIHGEYYFCWLLNNDNISIIIHICLGITTILYAYSLFVKYSYLKHMSVMVDSERKYRWKILAKHLNMISDLKHNACKKCNERKIFNSWNRIYKIYTRITIYAYIIKSQTDQSKWVKLRSKVLKTSFEDLVSIRIEKPCCSEWS